jgi:hypothetical protein
MITLQEVFDTLATGEFSNLKLGNSLLGTIAEEDYPKMVSAINLGLLDLHKRFPLRDGEIIVQQHKDVTKYELREERSATADLMDDEYYIALAEDEDWPDDLIKVDSLWEDDGTEIPLNDLRCADIGGFTPSFDILKMTPRSPAIRVHVKYRAKYPKIVITEGFDPTQELLQVPDYILEALLFFVAARVFRGISSKASEGETTSAHMYSTLYRTACQEIDNQGLVSQDTNATDHFINNGWV